MEYEGAVYHVTARGNERRAIFTDVRDREYFLATLAESVTGFAIRLYLFCLMTNHIHLVVETPRANLGRFMHRLQTAYTVYYNRRHQRCGHLLQGRYRAWLVECNETMLRLSRYVHLNPVFTGAARRRPVSERIALLREYAWSSYRSYIGREAPLVFVDYAPVLALIQAKPAGRARAYRRFVEAGVEQIDAAFLEEKTADGLCLGSEPFRAEVRLRYERLLAGRDWPEDIALRRRGTRQEVQAILDTVCHHLAVDRTLLLRTRRDSLPRAIAARMLCDHGGLTQRETAAILGLRSGAAVSKQQRRLRRELVANGRLRRQVAQIVTDLQPH
jgi:putative transposase